MSNVDKEVVKAHCNSCLQETNHFVIARRTQSGSETADSSDPLCREKITWCTTYSMLECCGCEDICLQKVFDFSEWDGVDINYFPPQTSRAVPKDWLNHLPEEMGDLLLEVYIALNADSRRLALMGARALVDLYMSEKLGDVGGFAKKLKKLEEEGFVSKVNKEYLEAALEAGHAAAHRGHEAKAAEVSHVMDIVENLLQNYVLEKGAAALRAATPQRDRNSS